MRVFDAATEAALNSSALALALFVQFNFSTPVRFNSSRNTIPWNGNDWIGTGALGEIGRVENAMGETNAVEFKLSGVPSENLALALLENPRNKRCFTYLAVMDVETRAVLSANLYWSGVMDQMIVTESGNSAEINITSKHFSTLFSRVKSMRYTDVDQRRLFPGDTALRFVASQSQHKDIWPAAAWARQ